MPHYRRFRRIKQGDRLGAYFEVPAKWFLDMQAEYDVLMAAPVELSPCPHLSDFLIMPSRARPLERSSSPESSVCLQVPPELEARLREQVKHRRPVRREPVLIPLPDGTQILSGQ
jgi:hypothetical protein